MSLEKKSCAGYRCQPRYRQAIAHGPGSQRRHCQLVTATSDSGATAIADKLSESGLHWHRHKLMWRVRGPLPP